MGERFQTRFAVKKHMEFSGVAEVKLITPINSLRIFGCKRWCNLS